MKTQETESGFYNSRLMMQSINDNCQQLGFIQRMTLKEKVD
jgi:hypothetical protein